MCRVPRAGNQESRAIIQFNTMMPDNPDANNPEGQSATTGYEPKHNATPTAAPPGLGPDALLDWYLAQMAIAKATAGTQPSTTAGPMLALPYGHGSSQLAPMQPSTPPMMLPPPQQSGLFPGISTISPAQYMALGAPPAQHGGQYYGQGPMVQQGYGGYYQHPPPPPQGTRCASPAA